MRFLLLMITLFISSRAYSQPPVRQMDSKLIGKDSVIIYYNKYYKIIESGCAVIIRYGHYDSVKKRLIGKFKDISKNDTSLVVSEGSYSGRGLKNGAFVMHYPNGKLQAKGEFVNDNYEGDWVFYELNGHLREKSSFKHGHYTGKYELYNEDGSPDIFMKITDNKCEITDRWASDGKKIIDNGNGDCEFYDGALTWHGKLLNGTPDGIWSFQVSDEIYGSEVFEKGRFLNGRNKSSIGTSEYTNNSRIAFLPRAPKLIICNADGFLFAGAISCDGTDYTKYQKWQTRFLNIVLSASVLGNSIYYIK